MKKIILLSIFILALAAFAYADSDDTATFGSSDTLTIDESTNVTLGYVADTTAPEGQTYGIYGYNTQGTHMYGATSESPAMYVTEDVVSGGTVSSTPSDLSTIQNWSKLGD